MITVVVAGEHTKETIELLAQIPNAQIADNEYIEQLLEMRHNNIICDYPIIIPPELTDRNRKVVMSNAMGRLRHFLAGNNRYNNNIIIVTNDINRLDRLVMFCCPLTEVRIKNKKHVNKKM